jgi:hypothetical protein
MIIKDKFSDSKYKIEGKDCKGNSYYDIARDKCIKCIGNSSIFNNGVQVPSTLCRCPDNQVFIENTCVECRSNQVIIDGKCSTCLNNTVNYNNECIECTGGSVSFPLNQNGYSLALPYGCYCPPFKTWNNIITKCVDSSSTSTNNTCIGGSVPKNEKNNIFLQANNKNCVCEGNYSYFNDICTACPENSSIFYKGVGTDITNCNCRLNNKWDGSRCIPNK